MKALSKLAQDYKLCLIGRDAPRDHNCRDIQPISLHEEYSWCQDVTLGDKIKMRLATRWSDPSFAQEYAHLKPWSWVYIERF